MSIQITRNVNICGYGMPMMPMMSMGGCYTPAMPIFGTCCTPIPVMCCGIMNNDMAAGYCIGTALGNPGVLNAIGSGLKWVWNHTLGGLLKKNDATSKKSETPQESTSQGTPETTEAEA